MYHHTEIRHVHLSQNQQTIIHKTIAPNLNHQIYLNKTTRGFHSFTGLSTRKTNDQSVVVVSSFTHNQQNEYELFVDTVWFGHGHFCHRHSSNNI